MGGERAATTRRRERGEICCTCDRQLDAAPWQARLDDVRQRERYCDRCRPVTAASQPSPAAEPAHRVYMGFFVHGVVPSPGAADVQAGQWLVSFLEPDLRTSIGRTRTFASPDKVRELIDRTPTRLSTDDHQALDYALANGRGGLYLALTPAQYRKLKG